MSRQSIKEIVKRLYSKGAFHVIIGTFLTKFIGFFGSIFIVRLLSKSDYGVVGYVENLYGYILIIAGLGLSNSMIRYEVLANGLSEKKALHSYIVKKSTLINVVLFALGLIINYHVEYPQEFQSAKIWVPITLLALPFQDIVLNELFVLRGFFENSKYAIFSFLVSASFIIARICGAYFSGLKGTMISRTFIYLVFAFFLLFYNFYIFFYNNKEVTVISADRKKEINRYGLQYMITNSFWAILMLNDTFLIGLLSHDPSMLADYKVAFILPGNLSVFANAIGVFVGPYFTKHENDVSWIKMYFIKVLGASFIVVGVVGAILFAFAGPLVTFMYGSEYANVVGLMRLLLIANILSAGIRYTVSNILGALGKVKENMIITAIGAVLLVVLDLVFIPLNGVMGVAYSNIIVHGVMSISLITIFYLYYFVYSH